MDIDSQYLTDVVVVGAGLAGIKAANELADGGADVVLLSESKFAAGASFHPVKASLGTQVTKNESDKQCFYDDIQAMGEGMQNDGLAKIYVDEIADEVGNYSRIGVSAKKLQGERKACFANHERDIYLLSDWSRMRKKASSIVAGKSIRVLERHMACFCYMIDGRVAGVFVLDPAGRCVLIKSRAVVLASGGFSSVYKHSLYPPDVDGSGHLMALYAGARLVNMEFVQFIPALVSPKYGTLFGEHTLRYAKDVVAGSGRSLINELEERGVDVNEVLQQRSGYAPFSCSLSSSCLDILMMEHILEAGDESGFRCSFRPELYQNKEEFFEVYLAWLKERGMDFLSDEIRILPFAHAANGGVAIDSNGGTGIDGLYAIGELSANVEGANRLGGNSTGACMVFGARAARACRAYIDTVQQRDAPSSHARRFLHRSLGVQPSVGPDCEMSDGRFREVRLQFRKARNRVKEIMYFHGGIVRTEASLLGAIDELARLGSKLPFAETLQSARARRDAVRTMRHIDIASIALRAMNERKESRGAHYRADFPAGSPRYDRNLFVGVRDNRHEFTFARYDSV